MDKREILNNVAESHSLDEAAARSGMTRGQLLGYMRRIRPGKVTPVSKLAFLLRTVHSRHERRETDATSGAGDISR